MSIHGTRQVRGAARTDLCVPDPELSAFRALYHRALIVAPQLDSVSPGITDEETGCRRLTRSAVQGPEPVEAELMCVTPTPGFFTIRL